MPADFAAGAVGAIGAGYRYGCLCLAAALASALAQAVSADAGLFRKWHVLTAEISAGNQAFHTQANWADLSVGGHEVVPMIRIEGRIDAARTPELIALIRTEVASLPDGVCGQLEIDHDSATARLAGDPQPVDLLSAVEGGACPKPAFP